MGTGSFGPIFSSIIFTVSIGAYLDVKIFGDQGAFEVDRIPVWGQWDEPPTPQMGDLFSEIWKRFYEGHSLSDLIDKIATMRHHVRFNELLFYLDPVHFAALDSIQEVHIDHGLSPETERPQGSNEIGKSILSGGDFFELIPQAEAEVENFSAVMFSIDYQRSVERRLRVEVQPPQRRCWNVRDKQATIVV